jgi:hypothetical protein
MGLKPDPTAGDGSYKKVAIKKQFMVAAGFTVKTQIPLNPPLLKGDFTTPLWKRGAGGIFHPRGCEIDGS